MPQSIDNTADCEIRSVIRFLNAKDVKATEIGRQISEVYGENIMSEGMITEEKSELIDFERVDRLGSPLECERLYDLSFGVLSAVLASELLDAERY
ncbi:hypothetical protein AVEN_133024-1 [Araneus ventricosus]|uniref:Mos1 transposase HTH domain-containing protein n=1 Tax=Araneus ventricosus TaxID=182803 RepID=A0A4Y2W5C8_ARAVE|nr:hypothetical protein AVEN_133024-1 [Araneus ventricosus]